MKCFTFGIDPETGNAQLRAGIEVTLHEEFGSTIALGQKGPQGLAEYYVEMGTYTQPEIVSGRIHYADIRKVQRSFEQPESGHYLVVTQAKDHSSRRILLRVNTCSKVPKYFGFWIILQGVVQKLFRANGNCGNVHWQDTLLDLSPGCAILIQVDKDRSWVVDYTRPHAGISLTSVPDWNARQVEESLALNI